MGLNAFAERGWVSFPTNPEIRNWVDHVAPIARRISEDPDHQRDWLRHGATWFAGVNILPNDGQGRVESGPPVAGPIRAFLDQSYGTLPLEPAQISVIYRGYPRQDPGESDGNHRFRKLRDAAHVDGLLPVGPARRRHLQEPHAYVLGVPLNAAPRHAGPMVVWEGSHRMMADAFAQAFDDTPPERWPEVDVTDIYQKTRRQCFEQCPRVIVHVPMGAAYAVHRLALHGVAPWPDDVPGPDEGRMIAYFRPELPTGPGDWLRADP